MLPTASAGAHKASFYAYLPNYTSWYVLWVHGGAGRLIERGRLAPGSRINWPAIPGHVFWIDIRVSVGNEYHGEVAAGDEEVRLVASMS
jgi:hypothetical protein